MTKTKSGVYSKIAEIEKNKPIFSSVWGNGAKIEVFYYDKPVEGEYIHDRFHILITPADSKPRGWMMTLEEAVDLIYGLAKASSRALEERGCL